MKNSLLGFAGVMMGIAMFGFGVYSMVNQDLRIRSSKQVGATVLNTRIEQRRAHQFVTNHLPIVEFQYKVDGKSYSSDKTTLFEEAGRRKWAEQVVEDHPVGAEVSAWVNLEDPENAFLLKRYDPMPYTAYMAGAIFIASGIYLFRLGRKHKARRQRRQVKILSNNWVQLPNSKLAERNAALYFYGGIAWLLFAVPALVHFCIVCRPPISILFLVYAAAYIITGLVFVNIGMRQRRFGRVFSIAELSIDRQKPVRGNRLKVQVTQKSRRNGYAEFRMKLVCNSEVPEPGELAPDEWPKIQNSVLYEREEVFDRGRNVRRGDKLNANFEFDIPSQFPASTPDSISSTEQSVYWELQLTSTLDTDQYFETFKIVVE